MIIHSKIDSYEKKRLKNDDFSKKTWKYQKKYLPLHPRDPGTLPIRTVQHAGPFFLYMNYTKQATTLAQQIQTLKQRGLIMNDEAAAEHLLGSIGYFRLAQYWRVFESDKVNHVFKPNSTIEKVYSIYCFDKELKVLVFSALQTVEVAMIARPGLRCPNA